jgi:hypothetical protein
MAARSFHMKTNSESEPRHASVAQPERVGMGWNDSSWELLRGLDVVEDFSPDAWLREVAPVELVLS